MANKRIVDLTELTVTASDDVLEITDVSDTVDSPSGTSKKVEVGNITFSASQVSDFDTEVSNNSTVTSKLSNLSEDTTPELGGTLDSSNEDIDNIKLAAFNVEYDNGSSGATATINWNNGNNQKIAISAISTLSFTAPTSPARLQLKITGGDSYAVTFPTITWLTSGGTAPTLDGTDYIVLWYDGTNYVGVHANQS